MEYDKSSQWLIQYQGASILRVAGESGIVSCRPAKPDLVQPHRIPDGLLEVTLEGETEPNLYLVEIETRPDLRKLDALADDLMLLWLGRKVLPELVVLVLTQGDGTRLHPRRQVVRRRGWSRLEASWHTVELWKEPAKDLLAVNDVGMIPWVPLAKFDGPAEPLLEECRERIDRDAAPQQKGNILAVTQVLMRLKYNDPGLFEIFGGEKAMIESPLIQELLAKWAHNYIVILLEARFGSVPPELATQLRTILDEDKLDELVRRAGTCPTLGAFETFLAHLARAPEQS
jgi:hypothetical protein